MMQKTTMERTSPGLRQALCRSLSMPAAPWPLRWRAHLLLFTLAWGATSVPLWPHRTPTFWPWGLLGAAMLVLLACLCGRLARRADALRALSGCVALIGLAALIDFWRLPPAFILAQCRSGVSAGLAADVLRHVETHWQWFPITNVSMLLWVGLGPHSGGRAALRLGSLALMFLCMGLAMRSLEALVRSMEVAMSAAGLISAMLAGMGLYHLLQAALAGCLRLAPSLFTGVGRLQAQPGTAGSGSADTLEKNQR